MTRAERERLEDERWRLENNFGLGSFQDGLTRQRIENIDRRLAAAPVTNVPERCPRCDSPQPHLHPAVQAEGEVQPCPHAWHKLEPNDARWTPDISSPMPAGQ